MNRQRGYVFHWLKDTVTQKHLEEPYFLHIFWMFVQICLCFKSWNSWFFRKEGFTGKVRAKTKESCNVNYYRKASQNHSDSFTCTQNISCNFWGLLFESTPFFAVASIFFSYLSTFFHIYCPHLIFSFGRSTINENRLAYYTFTWS